MAHIYGEKLGSARHEPLIPEDKLNAADNLILLCKNHHGLVDSKEERGDYPVSRLQKWKADAEQHEGGSFQISDEQVRAIVASDNTISISNSGTASVVSNTGQTIHNHYYPVNDAAPPPTTAIGSLPPTVSATPASAVVQPNDAESGEGRSELYRKSPDAVDSLVGRRVRARLIDFGIWLVLATIVIFVAAIIAVTLNLSESRTNSLFAGLMLAGIWPYEALTLGKTIGKRTMGLTVVSEQGLGIDLRTSLIRSAPMGVAALVMFVASLTGSYPGAVGATGALIFILYPALALTSLVTIFSSDTKKALWDMAAKTNVVQTPRS